MASTHQDPFPIPSANWFARDTCAPVNAPGIDTLAKVDLPMPKPAHRQMLAKVHACSLDFRNRAISAGGLKPMIDKVFGFDETPAAFKHLQSAQHFGKVVTNLVINLA